MESEFVIKAHGVKLLLAIERLKSHQGDGSTDISTDHFRYAGDDSSVNVACLFTLVAAHGVLPETTD